MSVVVHRIRGVKKCIAWAAGKIMSAWASTLDFRLSARAQAAVIQWKYSNKLCLLWHNRISIAAEIKKRYFPQQSMYGLISPSKDGAWLAEVYRQMGIFCVRGSSQRGGASAVSEIKHILTDSACSVAITPDGPRGPKYIVKPGAAMIAKLTQVPILLAGVKYKKYKSLSSWDKFQVPMPCTTVDVDIYVLTPDMYADLSVQQLTETIQTYMLEINQ